MTGVVGGCRRWRHVRKVLYGEVTRGTEFVGNRPTSHPQIMFQEHTYILYFLLSSPTVPPPDDHRLATGTVRLQYSRVDVDLGLA